MATNENAGGVAAPSGEAINSQNINAGNVALATDFNQSVHPLSREDANALQLYERVIQSGLKTFLEVGNALAFIRDARLYRCTHATFEEYLKNRWGISRPRGYELIHAAEVMANVSATADICPANESQARALAALDPSAQREVWAEAVAAAPRADDGTPRPPTAKAVRNAVAKRRGQKAKSKLAPTLGRRYPASAATVSGAIAEMLATINSAAETTVIAEKIADASRILEKRRGGTEPRALADALRDVLALLETLYTGRAP